MKMKQTTNHLMMMLEPIVYDLIIYKYLRMFIKPSIHIYFRLLYFYGIFFTISSNFSKKKINII